MWDAILCGLQASAQQVQDKRSRQVRVWLGMITDMAKVIEYYIPENFRKKSAKWISSDQCGKIIQFPVTVKKSA
jgi:hypothetical protein